MSHTPMSFASTVTAHDQDHPSSSSSKSPHPDTFTLSKRPWRPYITPFSRLLAHKYQGSGTDSDPYLVDWLGDDIEDPQQWSAGYKWFTVIVASLATLAVTLSSSAYGGGIPSMMKEFGASQLLLTAGISLFVVGFAFGPLIWAPLSEVYGRRTIYWTTYGMLTLWTAVTISSPNVGSILVFRFLSGTFGSSPLANAGGSLSDVLDSKQRGIGMALFAAAPFLGPALGPITGGFLGHAAGWKWVEAYLAIFCAVMTVILFFLSPETYAPKLLRDRAHRLSTATGKVYRYRADAKVQPKVSAVLKVSLVRPWKFLFFEPIVLILTIYTAIVYGILYLNFAAYPIVFGELRGWTPGESGLAFLGIAVGVVIAVIIQIFYVNPQYIRIVKNRGGKSVPEDRLLPALWGSFFVVIGLVIFATTDIPSIHWSASVISGIPFALGTITVFLAVLSYLVETYTIYAASVLAANSVLRSLFGAAFPLFAGYMFHNLGVQWAAGLLAFLAAACIPFTFAFYKYGAQIRAKCRYAADAERQMAAIMAARMAMQKKDVEAQPENAQSPTETVTKENTVEKKARDAKPAEQEGVSVTAAVSEKDADQLRRESSATAVTRTHPQHLWDEYGVLADRDMWDLNDEERLRLEELHKTFDHAKAKPQPQ